VATPRLTTYKFRVVFGDPENPDTLTERIVHGVGRDVQASETLFAQRGWGQVTDRPMTSAAAVAWAALKRTGQFAGTFDEFEASYLSVEPVESVNATPTEAAPAPA
jgi:hypothetical protein